MAELPKFEMLADTAYMPVPRCDGCALWQRDQTEPRWGLCCAISWGALNGTEPAYLEGPGTLSTRADFGCVQFKAKEPA